MHAGFPAELKIMPSPQPIDRAAQVMGVLAFAENGEGLGTDGRVVAIAEFDERKRFETGVEIRRKSSAGILRIEVRKLAADTV